MATMGRSPCDEQTTLIPRQNVRPYLELIRLEKPTGTILMFWPFAWGLTMAAYKRELTIDAYLLDLTKSLCAAFIVRSSACTVNDIFDRELDAGVERTKNRPLASGRISILAAVAYLIMQYVIGIAMFMTFAVYPLLKRVTHWPQAWLGFSMNFGFVVAWTATTDSIDWNVNATMMSACWWYVPHTIYACQDKKDDVKMGIHSTALLFGYWIRPLLVACAVTFVVMLTWAGILNDQGHAYFILSVGGTAVHLVWQFSTVDLEEPSSCWINFQRNGHLGWTVWGGMMLDYLVRIEVPNTEFLRPPF
ncbi:hypothetical protein PILCRDRAFT_95692 [Piloderma croceum F 1598]|uniref:Uncharacterized protein n=1 Tax=Piloderma croceum (strain F 1598) TaxID=765440 RepID=A0A0C3FUJ1_PILCF|nr:hypothetical protein PILCRDRAFT_95692 [Piloderma croceum F 1598]